MIKFRWLTLSLLVLICFGISACNKESQSNQSDQNQFWNEFYQNKSNSFLTNTELENLSKASFGYTEKNEQGYQNWFYGEYKNSFSEAIFMDDSWVIGEAKLNGELLTSSDQNSATRKYLHTEELTNVVVSGNLSGDGNNGMVYLDILHNGINVLQTETINCHDTTGVYYEINLELEAGDELFFVLKGNGTARLNPMISKHDTELKLHAQNPFGYWGDLIPYYNIDEQKMYMYYMIGDTSDLANPIIQYHLATSSDMFNFETISDEEYEIYDFVDRAVNLGFYINKLDVEKEEIYRDFNKIFKDGGRDTYFFFDQQVNAWRYIRLGYYDRYGMVKCALATSHSDDASGKTWNQPVKTLINFPLFKQPECPAAMYINDRWYIFCSLWGESIHNVGKFRYYIGDVGKGIDEQDWTQKDAHYLDGEDLCAAQIVDVGGRYLMYGWIVKCYEDSYFPKTVDNGLWGGTMSIQREVYQKSDGSLGVRLTEPLKQLLNKGVIESIGDVSNSKSFDGFYKASYIETNIKMNNATNASISLFSEEKDYKISFIKQKEGLLMLIGCDEDIYHPVASSLEISNINSQDLDVIILTEDNVIEVFVNDEYALSARTSMFSGCFNRISLNSDGAIFNNVTINKLANSKNIYD